MTSYMCPIHNAILHEVEDYNGAMVHDGCPEIFVVIDDHLCILDGNRWKDVETGEYREVQ